MSISELALCKSLVIESIKAIPKNYYQTAELEVWQNRVAQMNWEERLSRQKLFLEYQDNQLIGFATLNEIEIDFLYVHPKFWRKGIAQNLLAQIEEYASSNGIQELSIHASKMLFPLMVKNGFEVIKLENVQVENQELNRFEMRKPLGVNKRHKSAILFESERLLLREMLSIDAENFYTLNADWEVMKYTGDIQFSSVEDSRKFLENYDPYSKTGIGRYTLIRKSDGKTIGWCGLKYQANGEVDLGFRLHKEYWRQGFASEASFLCLDLAKNKFKIPSVIGRAHPENIASINTLKKVGMLYEKTAFEDGLDMEVYRINF